MAKAPDNGFLVVDCQIFQTAAWHRGMGKYSLNLLRAVFDDARIQHYKRIVFLFNTNLPVADECRKTLTEYCKNAEFKSLPLANVKNKSIIPFMASNKAAIGSYLNKEFGEAADVDYLILSLFMTETCVVFPEKTRNLLLFYDLIPFLYSERYVNRIPYKDYLANFQSIYGADIIFTISQTVANDLAVYLGIPASKLVNIDGAPVSREKLTPKKPADDPGDKFILMPSGDELRKNNLKAVKAFDRFNSAHRKAYKLVLTSFFSPDTIKELKTYSDDLIFTGNIAEEELLWLYEHTDLVLFATEYEGLGLPVLEAMTVGKKIACSDIPVFKEISETAFYYFDHQKPEAIAEVMTKAVSDKLTPERKQQYRDLLKKYTWQRTADIFLDKLTAPWSPPPAAAKPKIAIFTPHPAGYSAIGKVVAESHAALSQVFDIDYYFDYGLYHREVRPEYLSSVATCYDATEFNARRYRDYDAVIYHIGNSDYHLESIKNALYLPGYLIFHDTFLQGAYSRIEIDGYMTKKRIDLEERLSSNLDPPTSNYLTSLTHASLGVMCHSQYAVDAVKQLLSQSDIPVHKINLPLAAPSAQFESSVANKNLQICFAGILADVKGLEIIEQIVHDPRLEACSINLFGYDFLKPESIERLKKLPRVNLVANPSDFAFQTLLARQDILVNFRLEYRGETSLTVLESMRYGVVPIVRDIGWYSELSEDVVVKVDSLENVVDALHDLVEHQSKRVKLSHAAHNFIKNQFSHEKYAQTLAKILSTRSDHCNLEIADMLKQGSTRKKILAKLQADG